MYSEDTSIDARMLGSNCAVKFVILPQSSQPQQPRIQVPSQNVLPKVLLKAHTLNKEDPAKIFTLRNLDLSTIKSCDLKAVIKGRLSVDITADQYNLGYVCARLG